MAGLKSLGVHPLEGTPPGRYSPERYTLPVLSSSGGHRSGRYASYWNAFLSCDLFSVQLNTFETLQTFEIKVVLLKEKT